MDIWYVRSGKEGVQFGYIISLNSNSSIKPAYIHLEWFNIMSHGMPALVKFININ